MRCQSIHTRARTYTYTYTHTSTHTHARARAHTHARIQAGARAQTQARAQARAGRADVEVSHRSPDLTRVLSRLLYVPVLPVHPRYKEIDYREKCVIDFRDDGTKVVGLHVSRVCLLQASKQAELSRPSMLQQASM